LQSALLNIALNARDAMPTGGILKFETDEIELEEGFCLNSGLDISTGKYIQVNVIDTGTGMGLATVYGTIKEHKGAIDVNSCFFKILLKQPLSALHPQESLNSGLNNKQLVFSDKSLI
jgi:signal transduction histidine kinase